MTWANRVPLLFSTPTQREALAAASATGGASSAGSAGSTGTARSNVVSQYFAELVDVMPTLADLVLIAGHLYLICVDTV